MEFGAANRIAASTLLPGALLGVAVLVAHALVPDDAPPRPAIPIPNAQDVAAADPAHGAEIARTVCSACHSLSAGGPVIVGPPLWGVTARGIATVPGYPYSRALLAWRGRAWTEALLRTWLTGPQNMAPGTTMAYPGLPDPGDRADVAAYLAGKHE